jgi:hypothetical protein
MVVRGNSIRSGTSFTGDMKNVSWNPAPQPFVAFTPKGEPGGELQSDFVCGHLGFLIGVEPGLSKSLRYYPGGLVLRGEQSVLLQHARLELQREGQLILWDARTFGRVLWTSGRPSRHVREAEARFTGDGILETRDLQNDGAVIWTTADLFSNGRLPTPYDRTPRKDASLVISDTAPYLVCRDVSDSITFSTSYVFSKGWSITSGQYICLSASSSGSIDVRAPPVPEHYRPKDAGRLASLLAAVDLTPAASPCPTWLVLDPATSALVLHASSSPLHFDKADIIWRSPNEAAPHDGNPEHLSTAVLQGYVPRFTLDAGPPEC